MSRTKGKSPEFKVEQTDDLPRALWTELIKYFLFTAVFAGVAWLTSVNEPSSALTDYAKSKIGKSAIQEALALAVFLFVIPALVHQMIRLEWIGGGAERLADELIQEIPKVFFILGASATGVALIVIAKESKSQSSFPWELCGYAGAASFVSFALGAAFLMLFRKSAEKPK